MVGIPNYPVNIFAFTQEQKSELVLELARRALQRPDARCLSVFKNIMKYPGDYTSMATTSLQQGNEIMRQARLLPNLENQKKYEARVVELFLRSVPFYEAPVL